MKKIISFLFLLSVNLMFTQSQSHEEYMKRVLNSSQKPEAFTFSDYSKEGNVDVSTGRFGITIPFTTIDNQYLSLPISLSYSTSGVKVDENASEVGIGWNLVAGGQISRKLNGGPDDLNIGSYDANLFVEKKPISHGTTNDGWTNWYSSLSIKSKSNGSAKIIFDDTYEYGLGQLQGYNEFYSKYYTQPRKIINNTNLFTSDYQMISLLDMVNNTAGVETQRDVFHVSVGDLDFHFILKLNDVKLAQINATLKGRISTSVGSSEEINYEAVALDDNDIKIEIIRGWGNYFYKWFDGVTRDRLNTEKDFFTGFIVTDKRGIKYYFDNYLFTEPQFLKTLIDLFTQSPDGLRTIQGLMQDVQVNNWVLSKIELPNNEIIQYQYQKRRVIEPKIVPREHDGEYTGFLYNLRPQKTSYGYANINYEYEKLYIESISSREKTIRFNYDEDLRIDLQNGKRLKNIQLLDFNNLLIKQWDLVSTYKGSSSINTFLSKRLFLDKIVEKSITDRLNMLYDDSKSTEYNFDYYYPNNLADKNAIGFQDLYGYYLGNTTENAYPPFPKLYINQLSNAEGNRISYYPITAPNSITFNGVERRPNPNTIYYGALKEIKFPTGGSLAVDYEPNTFYSSSTIEKNLNGPGCRVKNMKYYSFQGVLAKHKRYNYELFDNQVNSSGILMYKPSFAYIANYVIDNGVDLSVQENISSLIHPQDPSYDFYYKYTITKEVLNQNGITDIPTLYKKLITTSTHSLGPQSDSFGREMIYTNVSEEEVAVDNINLSNGKTKYYNYYTDNRTEVNVISGPTNETNYYIPPCSKYIMSRPSGTAPVGEEQTGTPPIYPWNVYSTIPNGGIKVKYGFVEKRGKDIFPFPERNFFSDNNALKIGKTYKIEYFNNSNVKVQEKNYTYKLLSNASYKTLNFKIDYKDTYYHKADNENNRYRYGPDFKSGLYFYTIDTLYTKQKLVLEKEEVIDYNYSNSGSVNSTVQKYFNNSFLINRISKMNSEQLLKEDVFYYPNDFSQGNDINNLKATNRISEVIKQESKVGNQVVKSSINRYTVNSNPPVTPFYVLNQSYAKKGDLNILNLLQDDLIVTYEKFDSLGNLLQYTLKDGVPVTLLWGYNKTLPIAKIEYMTYLQVQSYESNLQSLSDTGTENNLIIALNNLRNLFPNSMITTYTYKPLIGLSTVTDPKGDTISYTYDSNNRLKEVRDKDGNILSENQYHYKN